MSTYIHAPKDSATRPFGWWESLMGWGLYSDFPERGKKIAEIVLEADEYRWRALDGAGGIFAAAGSATLEDAKANAERVCRDRGTMPAKMGERVEDQDVGAPSTAALAALLASHPEECAAVLCVFAIMDYQLGGIEVAETRDDVRRFNPSMPLDRVREILAAMVEADVLVTNPWKEHRMMRDDRIAVARVGAAAWLRARVWVPATEVQRQRAALARLHEIAAEEARAGRIFSWSGPVVGPVGYRAALSAMRGVVDIEAEVAAVWGPVGAEEDQR